MTRPLRYLLQSFIFLAIVAFFAFLLRKMLVHSFFANFGLNALILSILFLGIIWNILLILRLFPEVHWIEMLRNPRTSLSVPPPPKLLAPMAGMLTNTHQNHLNGAPTSPQATENVLDSLSSRMEEGRDISRYITQLLVFLGLLGTFYGLLLTVKSIADVISSMSANGADMGMMFEHIKTGLIKPLNGMATAFSGSMFGLAGSLILGFLDLTTGQAQNRFYNELEEWLLAITQLNNAHSSHHHATLVSSHITQNSYENEQNAENAYRHAIEIWIPEIQRSSQINADNLTILQKNLSILRDIALDANKERQQIFTMLENMNQHLETLNTNMTHSASLHPHHAQNHEESIIQETNHTLEKIERQIAGLRDDLRTAK